MESLEDWPEPIVRVQSLADGGLSMIPERYIKPPSERPSLAMLSNEVTDIPSVPVVDLGGVGAGNASFQATVQAISDACREWGFFQVVNHGVSPELMARTMEVWRGFFHLPMELKEVYANSSATLEGYGSRLRIEKGCPLDWGDYFFLHLVPESIKNHDKWPALPASCRETTEEYGREVVKLCAVLMRLLSMGLGLDEARLLRAFGGEGEVGACLRVNYFPRCPQPDLTLGVSSHSDPGGLTVLLADDGVRGLQVHKGDTWITVPPVPHAFIINLGDQIQIVSNATYKSAEHRVVVNSEKERLSLAFFFNPKADLPMEPAKELITPDLPPLYKPMTFNEHRLYIRKKGLCGKKQLESMKAK